MIFSMASNPERDIQRRGVELLRQAGFTVCETSNRRRTLNTSGTPDLFVSVGGKLWIGIEVKARGGKLSKAQARLAHMGHIYVCINEDGILDTALRAREASRQVRR